jgi:CRP-like cAMP-binding protein
LSLLPRDIEIAKRYRLELSLVLIDILDDDESTVCASVIALQAALRAADVAVRIGHSQLAVVLPMTPPNQARTTAKRLVRALPTSQVVAAVATLATHNDETAAQLLLRCSRALGEARKRGPASIEAAGVDRRDRPQS